MRISGSDFWLLIDLWVWDRNPVSELFQHFLIFPAFDKMLLKHLLWLSIFLSLQIVSSQPLKLFGQSCDSDCDERLGLTCLSSICDCMSPNSTLYDSTRSQCVTRAGHPCRRIGSSSHCVPYASCAATNLLCECDRTHFQTRNGTCIPVALYGEPCSSKKPCDKSSGMECVGSKSKQFQCQCKYPRDQYYSPEEKKCISYPGGNCSFSLPCVKNAKCSQDIFELRRGETPNGKSYMYNATVGKKCACLPGFLMTKSRECLPTYQTQCDYYNNNNCNSEENLKCFDNKICLCQNPLNQVYHKSLSKCLHLVGSKCDSSNSNSNSDCVPNAECTQEGVCLCKTGFSSTSERKCSKDFGQNCGKNECNLERGLSCRSGSCWCLDDLLVYDQNRKVCAASMGQNCGDFLISEEFGIQSLEFVNHHNQNYKEYNSTSESRQIITIECGNGLKCKRVNGYKQCVQ